MSSFRAYCLLMLISTLFNTVSAQEDAQNDLSVLIELACAREPTLSFCDPSTPFSTSTDTTEWETSNTENDDEPEGLIDVTADQLIPVGIRETPRDIRRRLAEKAAIRAAAKREKSAEKLTVRSSEGELLRLPSWVVLDRQPFEWHADHHVMERQWHSVDNNKQLVPLIMATIITQNSNKKISSTDSWQDDDDSVEQQSPFYRSSRSVADEFAAAVNRQATVLQTNSVGIQPPTITDEDLSSLQVREQDLLAQLLDYCVTHKSFSQINCRFPLRRELGGIAEANSRRREKLVQFCDYYATNCPSEFFKSESSTTTITTERPTPVNRDTSSSCPVQCQSERFGCDPLCLQAELMALTGLLCRLDPNDAKCQVAPPLSSITNIAAQLDPIANSQSDWLERSIRAQYAAAPPPQPQTSLYYPQLAAFNPNYNIGEPLYDPRLFSRSLINDDVRYSRSLNPPSSMPNVQIINFSDPGAAAAAFNAQPPADEAEGSGTEPAEPDSPSDSLRIVRGENGEISEIQVDGLFGPLIGLLRPAE